MVTKHPRDRCPCPGRLLQRMFVDSHQLPQLSLDLMQLPIRRLSHPSGQKTLDLVRKDVATLALVSPSVTFTIDDDSKTAAGQTDRARILSIPKVGGRTSGTGHYLINLWQTSSMLATFRQIHGRTLAGVGTSKYHAVHLLMCSF
jgi:hypothetical protein